jgi:hypothetical protein
MTWWGWLLVACAVVFPPRALIVQWLTRRRDKHNKPTGAQDETG